MKVGNIQFLKICAMIIVTTSVVFGQPPNFINARIQFLSAEAGLDREFHVLVNRQTEPVWIGYSVAMIPGERTMCCSQSISEYSSLSGCGLCRLENSHGGASLNSEQSKDVKLESPELFFVLFRIAHKSVEKIRMFSHECRLDAGGLLVYWLTDVRPAESVALLTSFATAQGEETKEESKRLRNSAIAAIALHADSAADRILDQFLSSNQPDSLRRKAVFWLGSTRGRHGYEALRRVVEDKNDKIREQAVFALSLSKVPEALDAIIEVAHNDVSPHVRGQALFWLAQKAGEKAAGVISESIERDPETDVKKRAVFALTQLPQDEGVPQLIEIAKSNRNPVVRKQAVFWLGQSKDPRALGFIADVLTH